MYNINSELIEQHHLKHYSSETPSKVHLLFTHGAGASTSHTFFTQLIPLLIRKGFHVWTFDFGYMHRGLIENKKRPPTRLPSLILEYQHIIEQVRARINDAPLWLGGKSMGGRVACHVLQEYQHGNLPEQQSFPKQIQGGAHSRRGIWVGWILGLFLLRLVAVARYDRDVDFGAFVGSDVLL